mmetsp:Transcript_15609/g.31660  ORF Transcript_15609/g.31660 Transcript_15609/m.31660 type:complete len:118 (-) Transcript_15609:3638-3991(-)
MKQNKTKRQGSKQTKKPARRAEQRADPMVASSCPHSSLSLSLANIQVKSCALLTRPTRSLGQLSNSNRRESEKHKKTEGGIEEEKAVRHASCIFQQKREGGDARFLFRYSSIKTGAG